MINELYIDTFLLLNFTVNYILLLLVESLVKTGVNKFRICIGSVIVAGLSILLIVASSNYFHIHGIISCFILSITLIVLGLRIRTIPVFLKAYITLCFIVLCMGGILYAMRSHLIVGCMFFFTLIMSYFIIYVFLQFVNLLIKENKNILAVELYVGHEKICILGLYDTGNVLKDEITGESVSIVSIRVKEFILDNCDGEVRNIPCRTIAGESKLSIIAIDKMCVQKGKEKIWMVKPWIGLLDGAVCQDEKYEIILNSEII